MSLALPEKSERNRHESSDLQDFSFSDADFHSYDDEQKPADPEGPFDFQAHVDEHLETTKVVRRFSISKNEEEKKNVPNELAIPLSPSEENESVYGKPNVSAEECLELFKNQSGLIWHAQLVKDDFEDDKITSGPGNILPRRPMPTLTDSQFASSLVKTNGRYFFSGVLNGWPAWTLFEVISITCKKSRMLGMGSTIKRTWEAGKNVEEPCFPQQSRVRSVRLTLRAPDFSATGWDKDAIGNVFWFHMHRSSYRKGSSEATPYGMHLRYGEHMKRDLEADVAANAAFVGSGSNPNVDESARGFHKTMPKAVMVHNFHHRYAYGAKGESTKDKLVYHGMNVIEWDHGQFVSVVELATLNGTGGRFGKSNWYHDRNEKRPLLYRNIPACMVGPWDTSLAEVRCYDIEPRNLEEMKAYFKQYDGHFGRFVDHKLINSFPVRLSHNTQADIMEYLVNYITRDRVYSEGFRHCQAFAADFVSFLAGKSNIQCSTNLCNVAYVPRHYLFLYNARMYEPRMNYKGTESKKKQNE